METSTYIEIETAQQNIKALEKHQMENITLSALTNEQEIIRLTHLIVDTLAVLARDYAAMAEMFQTYGCAAIVNTCIELPKLKCQLQCRKEARQLYSELLK